MTDDEQDRSIHDEPSRDLSRRDFFALSVAAGLAAAAAASAAELPVIETNVEVKNAGRLKRRGLYPSGDRFLSGRAGVAGCVGPAPCDARYWQAHRC
jgi:hypothetical protein